MDSTLPHFKGSGGTHIGRLMDALKPFGAMIRVGNSWSEATAILGGCDKRLHHLGIHEVAIELIQLR